MHDALEQSCILGPLHSTHDCTVRGEVLEKSKHDVSEQTVAPCGLS